MISAPAHPRRLTRADFDVAVGVLARAFQDDPFWCALLPNAAARARALPRFYRLFVAIGLRGGQCYGADADDQLKGVATWIVPGDPPYTSDFPLSQFIGILPGLLANPAAWAVPRAAPIFRQFTRMQKQYAPEPHLYLANIGVAPDAQGRGLSSRLIRPFLAEADARGLPAYTETTTPTNVSLYQHFGFQVMEECPVPKTGLSVWSFKRGVQG